MAHGSKQKHGTRRKWTEEHHTQNFDILTDSDTEQELTTT
jgi:hypothetical protein